jgi:L-alanine-DL-glutamate epimerase-like enolase superfamily enzyme
VTGPRSVEPVQLLGMKTFVCVNRLAPALQVSRLSIDSPSIVRLWLQFERAKGASYAWTLDEADALDLERRLKGLLQPHIGLVIGEELFEWLSGAGPDPDVAEQRARAAIDMALVDAISPPKGRTGRGHSPSPRIYASDLYDSQSMEEAVSLARGYVEARYPGLKMRLGRRDLDWARARLHAVRNAIGPKTALMVDAVQGWDLAFCHAMMPDLTAVDVTWLEDPFLADAYEPLRQLVAWSPVRICTGESCRSLRQVQSVIETGVPIVMLDIQHLGGINPTLKAMELVRSAGKELTFHVFTDISRALAGFDVQWLEWAPLWGECLSPPQLS